MILLKILLLISFVLIFIQDFKDREVYWFLFITTSIIQGFLFFDNTNNLFFYISICINLLIICILILILFLYTKFKLKLKLNEAIGIGDILFFIGLAFAFPPITFTVLFVFSLIFSLFLHFIMKNKIETIPLAGYMSVFFMIIYTIYWFGGISYLYML